MKLLAAALPFALAITMAGEDWKPPVYTAYRAGMPIRIDSKFDEPAWFTAPDFGAFSFPWWKSGKKEQTAVKILWDNENLYIAVAAADEFISSRHKEHDGNIPEDDCFEIMIAPNPEHSNVYFNIEWNVVGGYVDNFRPDGPKKPRAPVWDAEGIEISGSWKGTLNDDSDRDEYWLTEVKIPLKNFTPYAKHIPPQPGDRWNVNLNRHGGKTNPQYSQWSAGDTAQPSFHTPHRFGQIIFSGQSSPFRQETK